jgi:dipeptidyl aminopeptidase/acylaminoacyl peptidase
MRTNFRGLSTGLTVGTLLLSCASALPAAPRLAPLPTEVALSERSIGLYSAIRLSPDERRVAYTICDPRRVPQEPDPRYQAHSRTGVWRFGLGCDVWVTDTASGESKNLTGATGSNWAPNWSPDGRHLAFYSDRGGSAALWVWSPESGNNRQLSQVIVRPWGTSPMAWTPDGRSLVAPVLPQGTTLEQAANLAQPAPAPAAPKSGKDEATVTVYRSAPSPDSPDRASATGVWSTEFQRADLGLFDVESGNVRRSVTGEKVSGFWVSPDGLRLAVMLDRGFSAAQSQQPLYDLKVLAIAGGAARTLAERVPQAVVPGVTWSPDGKSIAYLTVSGDCFLVPAAGGPSRKITLTGTPRPLYGIDETVVPVFDSRGRALYFLSRGALWKVALEGGSPAVWSKLDGRQLKAVVPGGSADSLLLITRDEETKQEGYYEASLATGATRKVWEGPRSVGRDPAFRVAAGAGSIVFAGQDAARAEDLWILSRGASEPRRLTHVNPAFDDFVMGEGRLVEWWNADGKKLKGALLLPAGYQEEKRYPTVVFVYGGGLLSDSIHTFGMRGAWGSDDNFQLLATRGYAVFLPDAPSDWKDQMRDLPKNVLPGVNRIIELGIADPERLGIMGHSNGGYSTLALITLTQRFKAAVMRAGLGNLVSFYGEMGKNGTHYGLGVAEHAFGMGTPWDSRNRYLENSPIFYLDRVETPLLIVHGSIDDAVAPFLAEEVFVGLRRLGKEALYARYEGEGHSLASYVNQLDYCNRMIAWFDEHLKPGAAAK